MVPLCVLLPSRENCAGLDLISTHCCQWRKSAGPRLKRLSFPGMRIPILKIRWSWDRLIFNMGISKLIRRHVYIEMPPGFMSVVLHSLICFRHWFKQRNFGKNKMLLTLYVPFWRNWNIYIPISYDSIWKLWLLLTFIFKENTCHIFIDCFNMKMPSSQKRKYHFGDKTSLILHCQVEVILQMGFSIRKILGKLKD